MKPSSAPVGRPPVDKPTAWACLLTNAATVPGLGTIAGGRKVGYLQAILSLVGFGLSFGGLLWHLRGFFAGQGWPEELSIGILVALLGIVLYASAWLWALSSSIQLHREASRPPTARPPTLPTGRTGPPTP